MADIKYYDVILKPVVTEKSMNAMAEKKYTFLVHPSATKNQIKEAVEKMFEGTKVAKVNTMNNDGKTKRRGMTFGKTAKTKKAIVQLTEESADIEIFEGPGVKTTLTSTMNVYDVLKYDTVVVSKEAVANIEEVYA